MSLNKQKTMSIYLQEHLQLAHDLWKKLLLPSDNVIDATCGNGRDSLYIASNIKEGRLFCFDIQKKAIEKTSSLLKANHIELENVSFFNTSHENFNEIPKSVPIKLIAYNLGYLPGGDKSITTKTDSTINSIKAGLDLITEGGALSITCYSGHEEGEKEQSEVFNQLNLIDYKKFDVAIYQWTKPKSPCLLWIKKKS